MCAPAAEPLRCRARGPLGMVGGATQPGEVCQVMHARGIASDEVQLLVGHSRERAVHLMSTSAMLCLPYPGRVPTKFVGLAQIRHACNVGACGACCHPAANSSDRTEAMVPAQEDTWSASRKSDSRSCPKVDVLQQARGSASLFHDCTARSACHQLCPAVLSGTSMSWSARQSSDQCTG